MLQKKGNHADCMSWKLWNVKSELVWIATKLLLIIGAFLSTHWSWSGFDSLSWFLRKLQLFRVRFKFRFIFTGVLNWLFFQLASLYNFLAPAWNTLIIKHMIGSHIDKALLWKQPRPSLHLEVNDLVWSFRNNFKRNISHDFDQLSIFVCLLSSANLHNYIHEIISHYGNVRNSWDLYRRIMSKNFLRIV